MGVQQKSALALQERPELDLQEVLASVVQERTVLGMQERPALGLSYHLRDFVQQCPVVDWEMPCQELIQLFRERNDVECVVVCRDQHRAIGLIMKHHFFRKLGSLYGVSLFSLKTVSEIMDAGALQIDIGIESQSLIDSALSRSDETIYDAVIVTESGRHIGVLTVSDMLKLSRLLQHDAVQSQMQTVQGAESMIESIRETVAGVTVKAQFANSCTEKISIRTEDGKNQLSLMMDGFRKWIDYAGKQEVSVVDLLERMKSVSGITKLIEEIADQTNLLAVNAAIEAARAGEHGKGFAVVAGEIRALADQTKRSAAQIRKMLSAMGEATDSVAMWVNEGKKGAMAGIDHVEQAKLTFEEIWHMAEENMQASLSLSEASSFARDTTDQVAIEFRKLSHLMGAKK